MNKIIGLSIVLILGFCLAATAQNCPALSADRRSELVEYVRKQYKLKEDLDLKLTRDELFASTCYRELTFEGKNPVKTWQITLYLSPDGRFLTAELFDTTLDPIETERRRAEALMAGLAQNKGASKGPDRSLVTIVVFSDFECPFCRAFANLMDQVLPLEKDQVRVVFHHMPLSMHPWARAAAEGAACAQLQSSEAFWALHDQIFRRQQEMTAVNLKQKLIEYAQGTNLLDMKTFQTCIDDEMSLGLVFRDMNLASSNQVTGTPTLFINGRRIQGVKDAVELRQLIEEAKAAAKKPAIQATAISGQVTDAVTSR